jgi:hypothetical protein
MLLIAIAIGGDRVILVVPNVLVFMNLSIAN